MISCSEYDHIEIVCMYNYSIKLTLKSGIMITCKALDTQRNEAGKECIKVDVDGVENIVALEDITQLEVGVENPHFKTLTFSS